MRYQNSNGRGWLASIVLISCSLLTTSPAFASDDNLIKIHDLRFGETLYHFYQKKYFSAISDLMIARKKHPIKAQGDEPDLLLGGLYLSYNMEIPATKIFKRLAKKQTAKSIQSSAWYYLARIAYQQNKLKQAQLAIDKVTPDLPYRYNDEFQNLRGNILLKQKKYKEAISVLGNFSGTTEWSNYAKFNLAIALIKSGKHAQGIDLLAQVARIETNDQEQIALRDKANLALGYSALRTKHYAAATAYFKQVRLRGSQSNKALLGIGWAYHKEGELKRSLAPWVELKHRNSKDPAVQEALLTIPHALEGLNAKEQALAYYNDAINSYNSELATIKQVIKTVKSGEFIGALRALHLHQQDENHLHYTTLPDSTATPYLQRLIAGQGFQNILKTYLDLIHMKNILAHWKTQVPAYRLMLKERQKAFSAKAPQINMFYTNDRQAALADRFKELNDQFAQIKLHSNIVGLANAQEISLLNRLKKIKHILDKLPDTELTKQREQYRLYSGLIYWQIDTDFAPRHWQLKKELTLIKNGLTGLEKRKNSSIRSLVKAPERFSNFGKRIKNGYAHILRLENKVGKAINAQENLINRLVTDDLQQQQHQLENFHIRANYSLTRLYDSLAAVEQKP